MNFKDQIETPPEHIRRRMIPDVRLARPDVVDPLFVKRLRFGRSPALRVRTSVVARDRFRTIGPVRDQFPEDVVHSPNI